MGLRWASVTNMGKLPWTKANLTCVNSSEVYWLKLEYHILWLKVVLIISFIQILLPNSPKSQIRLKKWDKTWQKSPSRTHFGRAPLELDHVSLFNNFIAVKCFFNSGKVLRQTFFFISRFWICLNFHFSACFPLIRPVCFRQWYFE